MPWVIKAEIIDPDALTVDLTAQQTMYGGKHIARGDAVFRCASENGGGQGLVVRGSVTEAALVAKRPGVARQTPRVSVTIERTGRARRKPGRSALGPFTDWTDGQSANELDRRPMDEIIGIPGEATAFLATCF